MLTSTLSHAGVVQNLAQQTFRLNPAYHLVPHDQLPPAQRALFAGLAGTAGHYGLLVPTGTAGLGVLALDHQTAGLLQSLQAPGLLSAAARAYFATVGVEQLAALILDGVLQLQLDGTFVTGPAAQTCVFGIGGAVPATADRLAELAYDALRLAQRLPPTSPSTLSSWLYAYNTLPLSAAQARRWGTAGQLETALGLQPDGPASRAWAHAFLAFAVPGWRAWRPPDAPLEWDDDASTYKLYISPHPSALPEALPVIGRCLAKSEPLSFKLGDDVRGLLRPDKLVAYFASQAAMEAAARRLARALDGCPAHGVPFTAALTASGLLSWGIDPPRSEALPGWRGVESWRLWITNRLARALDQARAAGTAAGEPWRYALRRLSLEGVDIQHWLPDPSRWSMVYESEEQAHERQQRTT